MELIEDIMAWEKKHELFERGKVRGFAFYSYLRRELVNTAVNSKNGVKTDPFASKGQKDKGLKLFFKLLKRSHKPPVKNVDLLILDHPRRQKNKDVYESVFTDFLEESFPNSLTLERLFDDHSHYEPAMTKNICYTDRLTLKSYIDRLFARFFKTAQYTAVKKEVRSIMEGPFRELEDREGINLKKETYYERAVVLYYFYRSRKKIYEKFLDEVNPKVLTEVVSKSVDAMLLNELCRERGIPVIELQHSLLGPIARYPEGIQEKQSPTHYLSYSDYWSDYQSYPIAEENVYSCGSPYFERQVKRYKKGRTDQRKGAVKVLFISGAAYGKELTRVAVELKKASLEQKNIEVDIIYKLHPDEFGSWRQDYPELCENDINVIDSKDVSIYEYFNDCDAQVGVFSTAIYEGIAFELNTYILNIPFAGEFIRFCRDGYGTLIEDGRGLFEELRGIADADSSVISKKREESKALCEKFWKSRAEENIVARIREISGI